MQDLQSVYVELQQKKKERKEIAKMFQDELKHNGEYQELLKEIKTLREKKKSIEDHAKASALSDARQLDRLGDEIKGSTELLSDIALTKFMNGETIEMADQENNRLVPVFSVKFKKEEGESYQKEAEAERAESHPDRIFAPTSMVADTMTETEKDEA